MTFCPSASSIEMSTAIPAGSCHRVPLFVVQRLDLRLCERPKSFGGRRALSPPRRPETQATFVSHCRSRCRYALHRGSSFLSSRPSFIPAPLTSFDPPFLSRRRSLATARTLSSPAADRHRTRGTVHPSPTIRWRWARKARCAGLQGFCHFPSDCSILRYLVDPRVRERCA